MEEGIQSLEEASKILVESPHQNKKNLEVHFIIKNIFDRKRMHPIGCRTFIFYQKYFL